MKVTATDSLAEPAQRSRRLLGNARFMTLATISPQGEPWASTVNYVCGYRPLRLIWYSMRDALHSRNIAAQPRVSASVYRDDPETGSPIGLDGGQLSGVCRAVPDAGVAAVHQQYYALNFPEESLRRQWMLPLEQFRGDGPRRFYELSIERWWLLDIERWLQDKQDRRIEVALPQLEAAWPVRAGDGLSGTG